MAVASVSPIESSTYTATNPRQRYELLRTQLENERSSFIAHWRDLADFILPRRPQFFLAQTNQGQRRNQNIIDSTATLAARTLRSGMMSGVTSPARPWFRLSTPDPELAEVGPVKEWLYTVSQRMSTVFLRSNLYNMLPLVYGDMGVFGTASMFIEEDFDDVIRCYVFPVGSYSIANNEKLKVRVFFREFRMTVRQLVEKFGDNPIDWKKFSLAVKSLWDSGHKETWIDVYHVIEPNPEYDGKKLESRFKRFRSVYYETGSQSGGSNPPQSTGITAGPGDHVFLSEKGYDYFPVLAPRWEVTGQDVYGTNCPGMEALGDVKQLQLGERRMMQAIEKMVNPPLLAPTHMQNGSINTLPGGVTYIDVRDGMQGMKSAYDVNPRVDQLEAKQAQVRDRIRRAFFEDLFLMLAQTDRREITAREIDERHEEKLLALGPVLEQLNQDLLDPLIDITFDIMVKQGLIPPAPEEISGLPLKVEYISIMAQAQKLVSIAGVERFATFVGQVATQMQDPNALDKVDMDQLIDVYGDLTSVPPGIIRTDEDVEMVRQQRAQVAAQAQQAQVAEQQANTAAKLSQANLDGNNALTRMISEANSGALTPAL